MNPELKRQAKWDRRFMEVATLVSSWSKDQSTKVGCVIVSPLRDIRATGYNGLPRNICDDVPERHERPLKYRFVAHAEANAIFTAARLGISLDGCTIYISTLPPCCECAKAIIQSGIANVVLEQYTTDNDRWASECKLAVEMLKEAGVTVNVAR